MLLIDFFFISDIFDLDKLNLIQPPHPHPHWSIKKLFPFPFQITCFSRLFFLLDLQDTGSVESHYSRTSVAERVLTSACIILNAILNSSRAKCVRGVEKENKCWSYMTTLKTEHVLFIDGRAVFGADGCVCERAWTADCRAL